MDVSAQLAAHAAKYKAPETENSEIIQVDAGLLAVYDPSPILEDEYNMDPEAYISSHALPSIQSLLTQLFNLPVKRTETGPCATLPPAKTILPREKPLPKPKVETKWERFAKEKGIQHRNKDKMVWDEDEQKFLPRWGKNGVNKKVEEQWITEIKVGADGQEVNPALVARDARKARTAKNLAQQSANQRQAAKISITDAPKSSREDRKKELERRIILGKTSTGSMGKFDKKMEGEPKVKGVKRKFAPTEQTFSAEKSSSLALLSSLNHPTSSKKAKSEGHTEGDAVLNTRKAIRFENKRESLSGGRGGRGGRGGGRGRGRK